MAKKIVCKPAPEIELCYQDGEEEKTLLLRFDVLAAQTLQETEEGISNLFKLPYSEMCAALVYAAGAGNNKNFTKEDARKLVAFMHMDDLTEIVQAFTEGFGIETKAANNEYAKKLMAQFLNMKK